MDGASDRTCIVCEKTFPGTATDRFQPLEHFEDACICNQCLEYERTGWPRPVHRD